MGVGSVISTFIMCILFNIILPTGDIGSDIKLMYLALNFDLGDSVELEGCRACYHKTLEEVYRLKNDLTKDECKICLYDEYSTCGTYYPILKRMRKLTTEKETCLNDNETLRFTNIIIDSNYDRIFQFGECNEAEDRCCVTKTKQTKVENPIQKLDPKKLFWPCNSLTSEFDYCVVSGEKSGTYCRNYGNKMYQFLYERTISAENSSRNDTIFFYPYSWINHTLILEEKNHSIADPDVECGILIFRHNNIYNEQRQGSYKYPYQCNEDVCLTHLKGLKKLTAITDLNEWRKTTDHLESLKVGGLVCELLQIYGLSISIPILLNLLFNTVLYVNDIRSNNANIFEIIPLILFAYPQYRTIKFLVKYLFIHQDEQILNQEKEENDRTVAPLEPFLESCLQVNISLAILFTTEGFFPKGERGFTKGLDTKSAFPLITFILSLFASSFGMSKFFLSGPIQFLPKDSALNGLLSIPFFSLCLINSMFGFRIVCTESAFFTYYKYQNYDGVSFDVTQISPIISPEYRLLVYLAPGSLPFLINLLRLWCTTKGLWKYYMKYPQYLISPCFTPFLYEGYESSNQLEEHKLKIWKLGTIVNAIYIGCIPQLVLCITDYYKGVHQWEFGKGGDYGSGFENNDALFKSNYGNTIFSITTATIFLILIFFFFGSENCFKEKGIHCKCLTILCCPCPKPCIRLNQSDIDPSSSLTSSPKTATEEDKEKQSSIDGPIDEINQPHTEVYLYRDFGERKHLLLGQSSEITHGSKPQNREDTPDEGNKINNKPLLQENGESDTKATEEKDDFGGEISREKDGIELHSIEIHSDRTQVKTIGEVCVTNENLPSSETITAKLEGDEEDKMIDEITENVGENLFHDSSSYIDNKPKAKIEEE